MSRFNYAHVRGWMGPPKESKNFFFRLQHITRLFILSGGRDPQDLGTLKTLRSISSLSIENFYSRHHTITPPCLTLLSSLSCLFLPDCYVTVRPLFLHFYTLYPHGCTHEELAKAQDHKYLSAYTHHYLGHIKQII